MEADVLSRKAVWKTTSGFRKYTFLCDFYDFLLNYQHCLGGKGVRK